MLESRAYYVLAASVDIAVFIGGAVYFIVLYFCQRLHEEVCVEYIFTLRFSESVNCLLMNIKCL